jgi:cyanophycinase
MILRTCAAAFLVALIAVRLPAQSAKPPAIGPAKGALVVVGGGRLPKEITERFVRLAGGPDARFVVVPTADEGELDSDRIRQEFVRQFGATHVTVLHTRDPKLADSDAFIAPLREANAVWFGGGRQWRLVDSYLGTKTEREIRAVLKRGGVIGGTSAGATIQGSYLVRGAPEGNTILMAKGHEQGFGYLKNVAIDQHVIARKREADLSQVIKAHPELLGIGVDEGTAIVVTGDVCEVIGQSKVAITDGKEHDGKPYTLLSPGDRFDLKDKRRL